MHDRPVISFNPVIPGDEFCWERGTISQKLCDRLKGARAVILPQTVSRQLYHLCRAMCPMVFPNYDMRFKWEGKVGDTMLFWSLGVPHPQTFIYPKVESIVGTHPSMGHCRLLPEFPFVIKGNAGGEGTQVWLVRNKVELENVLRGLERLEWQGLSGYVAQEFLPGLERDLRVVVIGEEIKSYWRCNPKGFFNNLARGGEPDHVSDPLLQEKGRKAVRRLCDRTGINLAAFDLVFPQDREGPLFIEINYTFGRHGLGGSDRFYEILSRQIKKWLSCSPVR